MAEDTNQPKLKEWMVYLSMLVSMVALGKSVFFTGDEVGRVEEHLRYIDQRIDEQQKRLDRVDDRLQPQVNMLQETIRREQTNVEQQTQFIDDLRKQLKK